MDKLTVTVHDGPFQADEVFGCALLIKYYLKYGEYEIQRTRDEDIINASDIVLDVGEQYNVGSLRFDHHQGGVSTMHDWGHADEGIEPSSAGLVLDWLYDYHDSKNTAKLPVRLVAKLYRTLILGIDAIDNGIAQSDTKLRYIPFNVSNLISMHNATDAFSNNQKYAFEEAVRQAGKIIDHIDNSYWRDRANEDKLKKQIQETPGPHLTLDKWVPGIFGILKAQKALDKYERIVWPQYDGKGKLEYRVQVPPKTVGSFDLGGPPLDGSKVNPEHPYGHKKKGDLVFVHKAHWVGATRTKETAYKL